MKKFVQGIFAAVAAGGLVSSAQAAVVFQDDFESYADTAAMQGVWGATGLGTLDASNGFGGSKGMAHPGGTDNLVTFSPISPDSTTGIRISGKMSDNGTQNKRLSIGARTASTFPLFEMGHYNTATAQTYASRLSTFPGVDVNWTSLGPDATNNPDSGYHTFVAEFTLDSIIVKLDLDSNGSFDLTDSFTPNGSAWTAGFNQIRLGGPSNLSSAGGGTVFDDILVETYAIPEPSVASLTLIGGTLLGLRRKRR